MFRSIYINQDIASASLGQPPGNESIKVVYIYNLSRLLMLMPTGSYYLLMIFAFAALFCLWSSFYSKTTIIFKEEMEEHVDQDGQL